MEEERFFNSRENPRSFGFLQERGGGGGGGGNSNKVMSAELLQKPLPTPIVDRFRDLLKDREEELSILNEDDVPPPCIDEIVRMYEVVLSELTFNSKPIITELTMIAGEHKEYGEGIADAISARILEAPVDHKLPSLYLLDSIVKNIGGEYARYFASCLPEVFCEAYKQAHPSMYPAMRHLFRTWSAVFPPSVLHKIEVELQFSSLANHHSSGLTNLRSSESPSRPAHGIHVNPKYLEARRQFEHSAMGHDAEQNRAISSNLQLYGQKPDFGCDEYDINDAKDISSQVGSPRLGSPGISARATSTRGTERVVPSSRTSFSRIPFSPSRSALARPLSLSGELFTEEISPGRAVERTSPSHSRLKYSPDSMRVQDGQRHDWWMKSLSTASNQHINTSSVRNISDEYTQQAPRALIDAYGNHRERDNLKEKPLKIECIDVNGFDNKPVTKGWQNTEEEEYLWEEMSPTLDDRSRGNDIRSNHSLASSTRVGGGFGAELTGPDFRRGSWPRAMKDGISILGPSGESMSGPATLSEATEFSSSHNPQGHRNLQFHHPLSSQHALKGINGRAMPGVSSFPHHILPSRSDSFPYTEAQIQRLPNVMSRASSIPDSLNVDALPSITTSMMEKHLIGRPHSPSIGQLTWPPAHVNKSHPSILPQQQFDGNERKAVNPSNHLLQFPNQQAAIGSSSQQGRGEAASLQGQLLQPPGGQERFISSISSHVSQLPLYHGHTPQGYGAGRGPISLGQAPRELPSITTHPLPNAAFHLQRAALPPLPPGPTHTSSQMGPIPQNMNPSLSHKPSGGALSGLFSSLVAQGLISLTSAASDQGSIGTEFNQGSIGTEFNQGSIGMEFNQDLLKKRHDYAPKALYADLPRQCTACGRRFKCREDHSNHMDWHVTRNRVSKNLKQKPSRKWFVSTTLWLSGAEALGTNVVPGFLPTEATIEEKDDKDMAVPADENQNACALCGEPFDDFYSDEAEEWMYREAVYMNAPDGSIAGMDRSQLGPIVHSKCRSESSVSKQYFGVAEQENNGESIQRKKMRI